MFILIVIGAIGQTILSCYWSILVPIALLCLFLFYMRVQKNKQRRLEAAINAKDDYIAMLAHDMKTPIMTIRGAIEVLELKSEASEREKFISIINSSALQLQNIVEDTSVLALETQSADRFKKERVDIEHVIGLSVSYCQHQANKKNVALKVAHNNSPLCAYTNRSMLIVALRNIVANAVKYSDIGSVVSILTSVTDSVLIIRICDYGVGMQADKIDEVLGGKSVSSSVGTVGEQGSGIGLVNSIKIIKMLDGYVDIYSEKGKGTEVRVSLECCKI